MGGRVLNGSKITRLWETSKMPVHKQDSLDYFVFNNQILNQILAHGFRIGEISCPTRYFDEASSISFSRSVLYGLGVVWEAARVRFRHRAAARRSPP